MNIAIIGAGPAGLSCCKELIQRHGMNVRVFESADDIGGQWNVKNANSGVWEDLYMNTCRTVSEFSDFPWELNVKTLKTSPYTKVSAHQSEAKEYLTNYANYFGLLQHITTNSMVEQVNEMPNGWELVVRDLSTDTVQQLQFDAVISCTGRFRVPNTPHLEQGGSLHGYKGKVIHAHDVKTINMDDYVDKKVLVVGNSVSGNETCTLFVRNGIKPIYHSIRRQKYATNVLSAVSKTSFIALFVNRITLWMGMVLPKWLTTYMMKRKVVTNYPECIRDKHIVGDDFIPVEDINEAGICLTQGYPSIVTDKCIEFRHKVVNSTENSIIFANGKEETFDLVVLATGYKLGLEYLPKSIRDEVCRTSTSDGHEYAALYNYTFVPGYPTLAIIGSVNLFGAYNTALELSSRYVASVFGNETKLPPIDVMKKGVEACISLNNSKYQEFAFGTALNDTLAYAIGAMPTIWQILKNPSIFLFGPLYSTQYRINSSNKHDQATAWSRLKYCNQHSDFELFGNNN